MPSLADHHRGFREAAERLLEVDLGATAHDLTNELLAISSLLVQIRRGVPDSHPVSQNLTALDDTVTASILLARKMNERIHARKRRHEYASVAATAREFARQIAALLPDGYNLILNCLAQPCVVAASPMQLSRLLIALVATAIEALPKGGDITVEIAEEEPSLRIEASALVRIEIRFNASFVGSVVQIGPTARNLVQTIGGLLEIRSSPRDGTAVLVRVARAS